MKLKNYKIDVFIVLWYLKLWYCGTILSSSSG